MARKHLSKLRGRVLDIGCGYQPYKQLLHQCDYVGMDLDESRKPDLVGSVLDIPQEDNSFDGAIFSEVIEHIPEPDVALSEINRCLRPSGILYITAPQSWGIHYAPHDYFRFTRYGLLHLLEKNGFEVMTIEKIGGAASLISSALTVFIADKIVRPTMSFILNLFRLRRGEFRLTAIVMSPLVIVSYLLSRGLDRLDSDNVLGWAAIARKR